MASPPQTKAAGFLEAMIGHKSFCIFCSLHEPNAIRLGLDDVAIVTFVAKTIIDQAADGDEEPSDGK
jgi:hypothetical protein